MTLVARWREIWRGDVGSSDLGMLGEHRVAQSRVLLTGALTLLGLVVLIADPGDAGYRDALPVNVACLAVALGLLALTRRGVRPAWLSYTTCLWDVSLVSLLHVADLWRGLASTAANGRVTFAGYFLALVGTCVRWDRRLPVVAGLAAAVQYAGIAVWSGAVWARTPPADIVAYGQYDAGVQVERVVTLLLFALICRSIVGWALDLRDSAVQDVLTGLLNRRTFEGRLRDDLLLARRTGRPVSIAMIDVDHFKRVNDAHGHSGGDAVLRGVAQAIREGMRRTDTVARWGGEEFALICPASSVDETAVRVDAVRRALEARTFDARGVAVRITVSAGVAGSEEGSADGGALTHLADERLFEAKRQGRNRVVAAPAPAQLVLPVS